MAYLRTLLLLICLVAPALAEGSITWCDTFKVKRASDPTDAVSYAQGPGPVHPGDTYKLGSIAGNRLLFWAHYSPVLKLTGQNTIHITWSQVKEDGSEIEMQNQDIGGFEKENQPFAFIPFAVPGRFVMRIVLIPQKEVVAGPRFFTIEP